MAAIAAAMVSDASRAGVFLALRAASNEEEWGRRLEVAWAPGRWEGTEFFIPPLPDCPTESELLLAECIHEVLMERDQFHPRVWPLCPVHHLGVHTERHDGVLVWWCRPGAHAVARLGSFPAIA